MCIYLETLINAAASSERRKKTQSIEWIAEEKTNTEQINITRNKRISIDHYNIFLMMWFIFCLGVFFTRHICQAWRKIKIWRMGQKWQTNYWYTMRSDYCVTTNLCAKINVEALSALLLSLSPCLSYRHERIRTKLVTCKRIILDSSTIQIPYNYHSAVMVSLMV